MQKNHRPRYGVRWLYWLKNGWVLGKRQPTDQTLSHLRFLIVSEVVTYQREPRSLSPNPFPGLRPRSDPKPLLPLPPKPLRGSRGLASFTFKARQ